MEKITNTFATQKKNGVITAIGKSYITTPKTNFCGGSVKWFDDTQLIRRKEVTVNAE